MERPTRGNSASCDLFSSILIQASNHQTTNNSNANAFNPFFILNPCPSAKIRGQVLRGARMKAAVLHAANQPLRIEDLPLPTVTPGHTLLRVLACGVCRTDLHIFEGDLPLLQKPLILGHQIVGELLEDTPMDGLKKGTRVGVSWIGGTDGTCPFCLRHEENLCDNPIFTGYSVNGGYAEYALVRSDFIYPLPAELDNTHVAPLLCAGIIGFRSLRVAGTQPGERVGLFGFGASAGQAIQVLRHWNCDVLVSTRGENHRKQAESLGAKWVGTENDKPPVQLDRAITFAPSGAVVLAAISSLRKGGIVAINAIHLDQMPAFDYDTLLWGERQIRSVANMTRQDARDYLQLAAEINIQTQVQAFPLDHANEALQAVKNETANGPCVILP
jgi:propanol-preferring alcohol dehydrogenase